MMTEVVQWNAHELSVRIHRGDISCLEVMKAYLARIHVLNPRFNAIVSLADDDVLLAQASARDDELARGQSRGWMHGMPQAIKDMAAVTGFPA
ncbi:MAG: amidase, partial [Betaproteobacteria bacterium]|nr:amidase [Betaproteobacteria bacterium]